eukprot:CAMPEP_0206195448 /NCGR_PEP_ID=MMETSP0166-20121206/7841_1 /ASSEMBLY_ACC=CAM_ASM_000260 /TAXON_ID=95228 /ORGANISM="Vannella robusta, Strain DIVA3 518/3/11/1/6" /LENGTH=350 /DNA_ID=CAMNT_0053612699 /DNA_START=956 /DNA_END=2005 /DNA_ORIENTATION=-
MDETIEEGLNFLRSGGSTYNSAHFPITLGKRVKVSRDSLKRSPSPKRKRKAVNYSVGEEEKTVKKKTPTRRRRATTKKSSPIKRATPRKTTTALFPRAVPTKASASTSIYCPGNFNGGKIDFSSLDEFRSRTMKDTGNDERITEIVFSFDTTGSMGAAINEAKKNIVEITNRLFDSVTGLRIAIIAHGDYCDNSNSVFQVKPLSDNKDELMKWIETAKLGGGGDAPENYEQVLEYCTTEMNWTAGSHRVLVMIGDQVPHEPKETLQQMKQYNRPNPREIDWREQVDKCYENGIKIYGVQAHCGQEYVRYFYESLAARTCGTRVELNNFPMVTDMLLMVCFREANRVAFND